MQWIAKSSWTLVVCGSASWAFSAGPNAIDRPTPPPCAADGTCYPNENTWGWYPCHWRKWPGEELVPTPAGTQPTPAGRPGELNPYETPTPEQEDVQAPPSTKKTETGPAPTTEAAPPVPPGEEAVPGRPAPTPTPPAAPGRPSPAAPASPYPAPSYPTPNYPAPMRPAPISPGGARPSASDNDPPPAMPQQLSTLPPRAAAGVVSAAGKRERPIVSRRDAGNDPPPALPSLFHSAAL
jgi:hypothetical protein